MSTDDRSGRVAEVLRLGLVEGVGVRAIARKPVSYTHLDVYKRQH